MSVLLCFLVIASYASDLVPCVDDFPSCVSVLFVGGFTSYCAHALFPSFVVSYVLCSSYCLLSFGCGFSLWVPYLVAFLFLSILRTFISAHALESIIDLFDVAYRSKILCGIAQWVWCLSRAFRGLIYTRDLV